MSRQRQSIPGAKPDDILVVVVSHVRYSTPRGKDQFIIASTDMCPIKGAMSWVPKVGERLRLTGKWTAYQGEKQFSFASAIPDVPTDARGKLAYVCELTAGMGCAIEEALWAAKGEDWEKVEDGEVPKLKGAVYSRFKQTLAELSANESKVKAIAYLLGKGATQKMSAAAWDLWGEKTIGVVESNCYRLTELSHYGFTAVDKDVRHYFGITDLDPRRIRAALDYSLSSICQKTGDTCAAWSAIVEESVRNLRGIDRGLLADHAGELLRSGEWAGWEDTLVLCSGLALQQEQTIWRFCQQKEY